MLREFQDLGEPGETIITGELTQRYGRGRSPEREMAALRTLLRHIASNPDGVFSAAVRELTDICPAADSAGISLLERECENEPSFRLVAVAGSLAGTEGQRLPLAGSLHGHCLDAGSAQLYRRPGRAFPVTREIDPEIEEVLAVPFGKEGERIGVLWLMSKQDGPSFNSADERLLAVLGDVVAVAFALNEKLRAEKLLRDINQNLEQRVEVRTREVRKRSRELGRLALQLTQAEQEERRRIAQVLHDHLQQILVAAKLRLGAVKEQPDVIRTRSALEQVSDLITHATEASRSLAVELSPPILYDSGLPAALEWLARRMKEQHGLNVDLRIKDDLELDSHVKAFLFQATKELLFNVVKHSGTLEASLEMSAIGLGRVCVEVRDRGKGFCPARLEEESAGKSGFGLGSMRERLALLGGTLIARAGEGTGATMMLIAPAGDVAPEVIPVEEAPPKPLPDDESWAPRNGGKRQFRVLLADDHQILRTGLAGLLQDQPDLDLVAEAEDGQQAVEFVREHHPDVVVMDISMPRLNGIEATRIISHEHPDVTVIGLSMHDKEDMANAMLDAGAKAYVTKAAAADHLITTIRNCLVPA